MSALTRLRQGIRALTAALRPVDHALAAAHLSGAELALFHRLRRSEQIHSLNVLRALLDAGHDDADLLTAALLHDVGKTVGPFTLPERVLVVLVHKLAPGLYYRWGRAEPAGWRRPFAISLRHPEWSAQLLAEAGGSPRAVALVGRHQERLTAPPQDETERLLLCLQRADDRN